MQEFEDQFSSTTLDENKIRKLVEEFGDFIPEFLIEGSVDVPQHALIWTLQNANTAVNPSG